MLCDWNSVIHKIENMKSVTARSNVFMDSKLMMLKLRRARLGAQLAYSRHQSLLAEVELRLADADLKHEMARRRQFMTRSRIIRQTMKPLPRVASKEIQTIEIDDDSDDVQTAQTPVIPDKVERKDNVSSKKKRRTDKHRLSEEKTKSGVGTDETHSIDKATTSSKETNLKPKKKAKTDAETQCTDKIEKTSSENEDSREKRKERRHGKKSSKHKTKTQDNKKSSTSNNKQESHNDKHKGKDSDTSDKSAKKKHDGHIKKPKSVSKDPTTKDACKTASNDQASKGIQTEECSASWDTEKTPSSAEETSREASEEKEVTQPKNNKDIGSPNSCNLEKKDAACGPDFSDSLEVKDINILHQIKEIGEAPENIIDNDFEMRVMKRERTSSISSVETLKL